ncbi:MAG: radical SAM protein [Bacteroidales bacterium]|nr:radical SAM protein [Bacteroidales bacterium]MDD6851143.1 radical SAM protein [Bacteroidales bacterium]
MVTILFHETVFGPIHSRRLGSSLGVNLSPIDGKVCSFDCLYCEAGYNAQGQGKQGLPSRESVKRHLSARLKEMSEKEEPLDVITFSGNGEPTIHPQFKEIIHDTIMLRDRHYPQAKVSVLSNSTFLGNPKVVEALRKVDNNILKLDSAFDRTMRLLNRPANPNVVVEGIIQDIMQFSGSCIVQTMLLRGEHDGKRIDNTTDEEIDALIDAYRRIAPKEVMIYSIDRKTPEEHLEKIPAEEMERIGKRIADAGINVKVY